MVRDAIFIADRLYLGHEKIDDMRLAVRWPAFTALN
jgi:hypothetical protein